jgi:hypothetical protein
VSHLTKEYCLLPLGVCPTLWKPMVYVNIITQMQRENYVQFLETQNSANIQGFFLVFHLFSFIFNFKCITFKIQFYEN